jgi:hypothetical protein
VDLEAVRVVGLEAAHSGAAGSEVASAVDLEVASAVGLGAARSAVAGSGAA